MKLAELLKARRSVHQFEDRPVPQELIAELLDTAVWAPNHQLTQPWRFVLVRGEAREGIANVCKAFAGNRESVAEKRQAVEQKIYEKMMSVPTYLAVVMKEHPNLLIREEDYAATSCVIHNFSLLAWEIGLGMVWETYGYMLQEPFREVFGVKPGEKIVGVLHVGYPAKIPNAQPRISGKELLTVIG